MRIAILTAFDPRTHKGGIESYLSQLLTLLQDHGHEVDVFDAEGVQPGLGLRNQLLDRIFTMGQSFRDVERNYDMVVSNSFYGLGYFPRCKRTFNIYHSTHAGFAEAVRDCIADVTFLEWRDLCGYIGELSSGMWATPIAVSDEVKRELVRHYGLVNVRVVESGVDVSRFQPLPQRDAIRSRYGIPADAFVGIFVGRWDCTKGVDLLEQVMPATPDVFWVSVVGPGGIPRDMPQAGNTLFLESIPHETMPEIYALADFMLFPSRYEGFGLVVTEAMACGVPVISPPVGVARDLLSRDPFAQLRIGDHRRPLEQRVSEVLVHVRRLQANSAWHADLAQQARAAVERKYNHSAWSSTMLRALEID